MSKGPWIPRKHVQTMQSISNTLTFLLNSQQMRQPSRRNLFHTQMFMWDDDHMLFQDFYKFTYLTQLDFSIIQDDIMDLCDHFMCCHLFWTTWSVLIKTTRAASLKFRCPIYYCWQWWSKADVNRIHFGFDCIVDHSLWIKKSNHWPIFNFLNF